MKALRDQDWEYYEEGSFLKKVAGSMGLIVQGEQTVFLAGVRNVGAGGQQPLPQFSQKY